LSSFVNATHSNNTVLGMPRNIWFGFLARSPFEGPRR
jgi:hypothetical protein